MAVSTDAVTARPSTTPSAADVRRLGAGARVRPLIVSWYFPPGNTIGAVRVGKLAKFLHENAIDFRVLSASSWGLPETLPLEVPAERVVGTPWTDVNELPRALRRARDWLRRGGQPPPLDPSGAPIVAPAGLPGIGAIYRALTNVPDRQIGWLPHALRHAGRRLAGWRPNLIYASAPPFTSLLVADRLSARYGCPWVIEFRDRWVDDPYYEKPAWRMAIETRWERRLVERAAAIVTVDRRQRAAARPLGGPLSIVYTGAIYPGRRDPTPLFQAMRELAPEAADLRVRFYGTSPEHVLPLARRCGVERLIEVFPSVPYRQSIRIQQAADVLLLLQWNDPKEQGNVPAKLFEYLAAMRPILGLGLADGVPAGVIRARRAGLFANEPAAIADQLAAWLAEKRRTGTVQGLAPDACRGFSRAEQFGRLVGFLNGLVVQS
jgi:hypothetical protein